MLTREKRFLYRRAKKSGNTGTPQPCCSDRPIIVGGLEVPKRVGNSSGIADICEEQRDRLGVIRRNFEISEEQRLPGGLLTAAVWLHGDKYRVDLIERPLVRGLQHPALFRNVVFIERP